MDNLSRKLGARFVQEGLGELRPRDARMQPGTGAFCIHCHHPLSAHDLEYEFRGRLLGRPSLLRLHVRCFDHWQSAAIAQALTERSARRLRNESGRATAQLVRTGLETGHALLDIAAPRAGAHPEPSERARDIVRSLERLLAHVVPVEERDRVGRALEVLRLRLAAWPAPP